MLYCSALVPVLHLLVAPLRGCAGKGLTTYEWIMQSRAAKTDFPAEVKAATSRCTSVGATPDLSPVPSSTVGGGGAAPRSVSPGPGTQSGGDAAIGHHCRCRWFDEGQSSALTFMIDSMCTHHKMTHESMRKE